MASVVQTAVVYILTIFAICEVNCAIFRVPQLKALSSRSIRISIKDEAKEGYSVFGFHGNINKPIKITDNGELTATVFLAPSNPVNFTLNINDRIDNINIGDTIYYWIFLRDLRKEEQIIGNLEFTVTEFTDDDEISTLGSCTLSITEIKGQEKSCEGSLIFSEEFNEIDVKDLTQWDQLIQLIGEPDYPFNMYMSDKTISLEDGSLVITPILTESIIPTLFQPLDLSDRCTGEKTSECIRHTEMLHPVTTGKITTNRTFSFKYGRIDVRAKLPSGKWILPEIHLEPTDYEYGTTNYASGLIRIACNDNREGNTDRKFVFSGPVFRGNQLYNNHTMGTSVHDADGNWDEDFHNYTLIWTPESFLFYVDGESAGRTGYVQSFAEDLKDEISHASRWLKGTKMAPFDQMFHVTLGLRVGGVNEFSKDEIQRKPFLNTYGEMSNFWRANNKWYRSWIDGGAMKIDHVRVYAL